MSYSDQVNGVTPVTTNTISDLLHAVSKCLPAVVEASKAQQTFDPTQWVQDVQTVIKETK